MKVSESTFTTLALPTPNLFSNWNDIPNGIILIRMFHQSTNRHFLHLHLKLNDDPWYDQPKFPSCYSEASSNERNKEFWEWAAANLPTWEYPTPVEAA